MATVLTPMARERFADWIVSSQRDYAASLVSTGETPTQAAAHAQRSSDESFPGGVLLPNHHVFDVVNDDSIVGYLWIGPMSDGALETWWIWDIQISAEHRGQGLGRAAMALAEDAVKGFGGSSIGLNVFRYNTAALHLYESVGYETRSHRMFKAL
jgi:ribosomal protein S18 acetylase RimI-like enzyme